MRLRIPSRSQTGTVRLPPLSRLSTLLVGTVIATLLATSLVGCGEKDPEENFGLWSNNAAGWAELGKYVGDSSHDVKLRARGLEVLMTSGQPTHVIDLLNKHVADKAEREKILLAMRPAMEQLLKNPNEKLQRYAKQVLFDSLEMMSPAEADKNRKILADWAFGDFSHDDSTSKIVEKLGRRVRPEEIEKLGNAGVKGGEIMLAKGIARGEILVFLQGLKSPEGKAALIAGLRRYHTSRKNVKVMEGELGFIQRTQTMDGLLYFLELYVRLSPSEHPSDKAAGSLAIVAAMEWLGTPAGKALVKKDYKRIKPFVERFLVRDNCDDRWWAVQMMVNHEGVAGLKAGLNGLKDDMNYGQDTYANNDVKLMITDICKEDVGKHIGFAKARGVFDEILKLPATNDKGEEFGFVKRIVSIRCLAADASPEARAALDAYVTSRKKMKKESVVDPLIVPQHGEGLTLTDVARVALDIVDYTSELDKLAAAGKLTKDQVKWRKTYAGYSFDRRMKALKAFAEDRAESKIKRDAKKDAAEAADAKAGAGKAAKKNTKKKR